MTCALNLTKFLGKNLAPPHATFLGLDGAALWEADASALAGDLVVLTWSSGLYRLRWNGSAFQANRISPADLLWWAIDFRGGEASTRRTGVAPVEGSAAGA